MADLSRTALFEGAVPEIRRRRGPCCASTGSAWTANNVTYAVLGESFRCTGTSFRFGKWLGTRLGTRRWGMVPLWGFHADIVASAVADVPVGGRVYGYLPHAASHLVVRPGRADARGFRDASPHRAQLPSPYNAYALTTGDAAYRGDQEDLLILYRPLFFTSFMLADYLQDNTRLVRRRGARALLGIEQDGLRHRVLAARERARSWSSLTSAQATCTRSPRAWAVMTGCCAYEGGGSSSARPSPRPTWISPGGPTSAAGSAASWATGWRTRRSSASLTRSRAEAPRRSAVRVPSIFFRARPDAQALSRLGPRGTGLALRAGVAKFRRRCRRRLGRGGQPPRATTRLREVWLEVLVEAAAPPGPATW